MTAKQYLAALEELELSQRRGARVLGIDERTSRRYALGEAAVPPSIAKLLRIMIQYRIPPETVEAL